MGKCHAGAFDECIIGSHNAKSVRPLSHELHSCPTLPASFVFDNFTWERGVSDYSTYNDKLIPARIPLSAIISGTLHVSILPTPCQFRSFVQAP